MFLKDMNRENLPASAFPYIERGANTTSQSEHREAPPQSSDPSLLPLRSPLLGSNNLIHTLQAFPKHNSNNNNVRTTMGNHNQNRIVDRKTLGTAEFAFAEKPATTAILEAASSPNRGATAAANFVHHRQRRKQQHHQQWWQQSVVRRTIGFIEQDFENVVRSSPFLQQAAWQRRRPSSSAADSTNSTPGLFHRSELQTGKLLGKGGFSMVYEVSDIILDEDLSRQLTPAQNAVRQHYVRTVRRPSDGTCRYAIKFLKESLLQNSGFRSSSPPPSSAAPHQQQFQCAAADLAIEAAYMSALHHPHVLAVHGLPVDGVQAYQEGRHDGYFIMTERLDCTLEQQIVEWNKHMANIEQAPQDEDSATIGEKMSIALQLAEALEYLHSNRIVFRDLKPANIGCVKDPETGAITVKVFDFGLCRELPPSHHHPGQYTSSRNMSYDDDLSMADDVYEMSGVGTRRYMATEVINTGCYNCKADVYSWSLVVWEMLTGERPFATYSMEDHRIAVCQGGERPDLPSQWPWSIRHLLQQSWLEHVSERLSMREVGTLLRTIVQAQQVLQQHQDEEQEAAATEEEESLLSVEQDSQSLATTDAPSSPNAVNDERILAAANRQNLDLLKAVTEGMKGLSIPPMPKFRMSFAVPTSGEDVVASPTSLMRRSMSTILLNDERDDDDELAFNWMHAPPMMEYPEQCFYLIAPTMSTSSVTSSTADSSLSPNARGRRSPKVEEYGMEIIRSPMRIPDRKPLQATFTV